MDKKNLETICKAWEAQPKPLTEDAAENTVALDERRQFLGAMAEVWRVVDEHGLKKDVSFTNFVMFGPQSVGKSTLTERILGFPVAYVKGGMATTRPMVLTTLRAPGQNGRKVEVREGTDEFKVVDEKEVMEWTRRQMQATHRKIISDAIYIQVSGPDYETNRRFTDLPGFISNTNVEGTDLANQEAIVDLLKEAIQVPDTVVVLVENATNDFETSNLGSAIRKIYNGSIKDRPDLTSKFVLAFNKADELLRSYEMTPGAFLERVAKYTSSIGLAPVLVGSSIDADAKELRQKRATDTAGFDEICEEYRTASGREKDLFENFLVDFEKDPSSKDFASLARHKFFGFDKLLGILDRMVIDCDLANAPRILKALQGGNQRASKERSDLEKQSEALADTDKKLEIFVLALLSLMEDHMLDKPNGTAADVYVSEDIDEYGVTAEEEEREFYFQDDGDDRFERDERYDSGRQYDAFDSHAGSKVKMFKDEPRYVEKWKRQMEATIKTLQENQKKRNKGAIKYLGVKQIGFDNYSRTLAVWASTVYGLLKPSEDDVLFLLASVRGTNPFQNDPRGSTTSTILELVAAYIRRLEPAIKYLCQKVEFLKLLSFDSAMRAMERNDNHKDFLEAFGKERIKEVVRDNFRRKLVKEAARVAYFQCVRALRNESRRILPYGAESASSAGMGFAFEEGDTATMQQKRKKYETDVKATLLTACEEVFDDDQKKSPGNKRGKWLAEGAPEALGLIACFCAIDPLIFTGLQLLKAGLMTVVEQMKQRADEKNKANKTNNETENKEEKDFVVLLGAAASVYAQILPGFIATIDGEVRGELWGQIASTSLQLEVKDGVLADFKGATDQLEDKKAAFMAKIDKLDKEIHGLETAEKKLRSALAVANVSSTSQNKNDISSPKTKTSRDAPPTGIITPPKDAQTTEQGRDARNFPAAPGAQQGIEQPLKDGDLCKIDGEEQVYTLKILNNGQRQLHYKYEDGQETYRLPPKLKKLVPV